MDQNISEPQLINELEKLKAKLERIQLKNSNNKLTPEELSALLAKLQRIRSKVFWYPS